MKNRKRILAGLLAVVMTISILPASVFAADMSAVPAEENDAEPGIVSNEEYEVEPAAEAISDQDAQQETEDPTVETGKNEASEPEDQLETAPVSRTEEVQEAEPVSGAEGVQEAAPASEPEEEEPAKEETEPAAVEEASETEEAAAEKEAAVEPVTLTYEGRDYMVTAAFDPSAFPAGVQMKVREIRKSNSSYQDLYDQALETVQKETEEEVEITHVRFFDITFYTDKEDNIEPDGTVNVNIKYTKALTVESTDDISVLHFDEKKEEPQLMEIETSGSRDDKVDEISFDTESFSVYAIIGTEPTVKRLTVNFYGVDTGDNAEPIATMYVDQDEQTTEGLEKAVYDPQSELVLNGYTFYGWSQNKDCAIEDAETIDDIRYFIKNNINIATASSPMKVYAVLYKHYTVEYVSWDGSVVFKSENFFYKDPENGGDYIEDYTVSLDYPLVDADKFEGWKPSVNNYTNIVEIAGSSDPTIISSETLIMNETPIRIKGDVSFIAHLEEGHWLRFNENGKNATYTSPQYLAPSDDLKDFEPEDPERTGYSFGGWWIDENTQFVFSGPLEANTTVFAKWNENPTAGYRINIWKQRLLRNPNQSNEAANNAYIVNNKRPDGFELVDVLYYENRPVWRDGSTPGTRIRNTIAMDAAVQRVTQSDARNDYLKIKIPDRATGLLSENAVQEEIRFEGCRCSYIDSDNTNIVITPEGDAVLNVYFTLNQYTLYFNLIGNVFNLENKTAYFGTPIGPWVTEQTTKALISFKATADSDYFHKNDVVWYFTTMPHQDLTFDVKIDVGFRGLAYYLENVDGTYSYYSRFFSKVTDWNYKDFPVPDGYDYKTNYFIKYQDTSQWYQLPNYQWVATGGFVTEEEGQTTKVPVYDPPVPLVGPDEGPVVAVFFDRNSYSVTYRDGVYVDSDENVHPSPAYSEIDNPDNTTKIKMGAGIDIPAIRDFVPSGPDPKFAGQDYVFAGWYLDRGCNERCDFSTQTMPRDGLTLYAKWHVKQYRVFFRPKAGTSNDTHNNLSWGKGSDEEDAKAVCFRVDVGERISPPTGKRTGYKFDGWYLNYDEEKDTYSDPLPDDYVLTESNTIEYDKTDPDYFTDPMDKYGNGATENKDAIEHRDWVLRCKDIYAKWIPSLIGADGIKLVYLVGADQHPIQEGQDILYTDNTEAIARAADAAVQAAPDGKIFTGWELQKYVFESGFETTDTVLPGEAFPVKKENAMITDPDNNNAVVSFDAAETAVDNNFEKKFDYTIHLIAKYEDKESAATTYIPWYWNDNTRYFRVDTIEPSTSRSTLPTHQGVNIAAAPAEERLGYRFLGWGRVRIGTNAQEAISWMGNTEKYTQTLDEDDIFLYYNEEDGKYYLSYSEDEEEFSSEVTQIAADSKNYDAMYAVWEEVPTFKVYHSADGQNAVPDEYNIPSTKGGTGTFNMIEHLRPGYMYGGYYEYDETTKSKNFADYGPGNAMVPGEDQVYYLKEVNVNYLKPQLYIIYSQATKVISSVYGLVNVDIASMDEDDQPYYSQCGLLVRNTKNTDDEFELFLAEGNTVAEEIKVMKDGSLHRTLNKKNFGDAFKAGGSLAGSPCYIGFSNISKSQYEPYTSYIAQGAELEIKAFYDTPDGIRVTGSKLRKITFEGTEGSTDPVFYNGWKSENNPNGTRTGLVEDKTEKIEDLNQDDDGKGRGIQNDDGKKKVTYSKTSTINASEGPVKYTVNMFEGTEKLASQTVEAGNNTGKINIPEKEEYLFIGWFQDEDLSVPADFSDVQGDMMVYAGYIPRKDVTLSLARKTGKTGSVTFTATVSIKNTNKFTEVGVICGHNEEETQGALTKKTYLNTGTTKNPKYTYKFSGPVEVNDLTLSDKFTASVYWVTKDGTKVTEDARTCTYSSGSVRVQK